MYPSNLGLLIVNVIMSSVSSFRMMGAKEVEPEKNKNQEKTNIIMNADKNKKIFNT
ncbi:hypothetical protein PU02_0463 [Bartonella ancashensis]|uniref:Uncharacterized protein n=1 Tax=Bartonella ancashensis TaxID=1318743 RepID=A0A0M4LJ60_9HYPH|nr:hypothetical protein PU02_0463 [Bartonella ancashensis]